MLEKEAYFSLLRSWINQVSMSRTSYTYFPLYLAARYSHLLGNERPIYPVTGLNNGNERNVEHNVNGVRNDQRMTDYFDGIRQEEIINRNGGYEFKIAPLWKRFLAEIIDVIVLLLLKVMVTFTVVDMLDINISNSLNMEKLKKAIESNYVEFIFLTSDFLLLELITRIGVCFYEAIWTMTGHIYVGGATPGKILLGIRILYVEAVVPLEPFPPGMNINNGRSLRALLYPAENMGFRRAFLRSVAKNILMALFFPMCFIILFFKNNRTGYDILTKTIVVEENHAPILRRR